ncbi:MAG TPA: protein kinase, partial [Gemmatimonadaceae bacterium]|nr:protein kinase [Gemmatimonadaceae bacterium]
YRGYDPELDIPVAIKVLKPQFAGDETFESRFRREASIAAKLRHPNIVRILAVGREADAVYFVMDYLPNSLVERLRVIGAMPEAFTVRMGVEVAVALGFAHREGVIHRDVKADNILFDPHGNAIVADFGIARAVSSYVQETGTNMVVGTPQYFSPEQARGLPLDGRADIYSLGVTLFRAATGSLPFDGSDWYEIARQHVEDRPPKPRSLNPSISAELERIILCCLAKAPEERFESGEALGEALAELSPHTSNPMTASTLQVPRITPSDLRGAPWARIANSQWVRRGVLALGMGAALLAIVFAVTRDLSPRTANVTDTTGLASDIPSVLLPPVETLVPDTTAADDTLTEQALATIRITAPDSALVLLDGRQRGRGGNLRLDVRPGTRTITATFPDSEGCSTATVSRQLSLSAGENPPLTLAPQRCGTLVFNVTPSHATFAVNSPSGISRRGTVDEDSVLILPAGAYSVRLSADGCLEYESQVTISARERNRLPARLDCTPRPPSR